MERFQGYTRLLSTGAPAPGATVTVYHPAGTLTLATIYDDDNATPTPKANPFTADASSGFFYFYAANSRYDVKFSGGGIPTPYTWGDVTLGIGDGGLTAATVATLPTSNTQGAGRLRRLTDSSRGIWMDQGTQWFSILGNVANVKEFGAKGDGTADDTSAIAAALASGAKIIRFPTPSVAYRITSVLTPVEGQILIGDGADDTLIRQDTANTDAIKILGISYVEIKNLAVQGGSGTGNAITCRSDSGMNCTDFLIESVVVKNSGQHGISMEGVRKGRLINVEASNNGAKGYILQAGGAGFASSDNTYFYGCFAGGNDIGFQLGTGSPSEAQNCRFFGCAAETNDTYGWNILASPNNFYGCHSEGNGGGGTGTGDWNYATTGGCSLYGCRSENGDFAISGQINVYGFRGGSGTITVASGTFEATLIDCTGTITDNNGKTVILGNNQNSNNLGAAETLKYGGGIAVAGALKTQYTRSLANVQSVSTVATTIFALSGEGNVIYVNGREQTSGARFLDIVLASDAVNPSALHSFAVNGTPANRTYTRSGSNLQLAMASDTYDVSVHSLAMPNPN